MENLEFSERYGGSAAYHAGQRGGFPRLWNFKRTVGKSMSVPGRAYGRVCDNDTKYYRLITPFREGISLI